MDVIKHACYYCYNNFSILINVYSLIIFLTFLEKYLYAPKLPSSSNTIHLTTEKDPLALATSAQLHPRSQPASAGAAKIRAQPHCTPLEANYQKSVVVVAHVSYIRREWEQVLPRINHQPNELSPLSTHFSLSLSLSRDIRRRVTLDDAISHANPTSTSGV